MLAERVWPHGASYYTRDRHLVPDLSKFCFQRYNWAKLVSPSWSVTDLICFLSSGDVVFESSVAQSWRVQASHFLTESQLTRKHCVLKTTENFTSTLCHSYWAFYILQLKSGCTLPTVFPSMLPGGQLESIIHSFVSRFANLSFIFQPGAQRWYNQEKECWFYELITFSQIQTACVWRWSAFRMLELHKLELQSQLLF